MLDMMNVNDIAFPHLGIYLSNVPQGFSIFGFWIAIYGVMIGIGVLSGVLMAVHIAKKENLNPDIIWDFAMYAVIISVICARIYFVVFSWDQYKDDLLSIFNTRQGGLAIYGGVIGAFATLFVYSSIKKVKPTLIGDCGVHGLVLGQIIGRWGNFFNREAFGDYTNNLFAMRLPVDFVRANDVSALQQEQYLAGGNINYIQAHPTFLYEGSWNFVLLIFMLWYRKYKKFDGEMCLIYLGGYGFGRFLIESLRTDQLHFPGTDIAVSQMLGITLFVVAIIIDVFIRMQMKKRENAK